MSNFNPADIKAPEPSRKVSLEGPPETTEFDAETLKPVGAPSVPQRTAEPSFPAPSAPSPETRTSLPPQAPDLAAEIAALKKEKGEARREIGRLKDEHSRAVEELRFQMQMAMAAAAPQQQFHQAEQQEVGFDPSANPTWGQLQQVMSGLQHVTRAAAIRAVWDVTPQEEQLVYSTYPNLANMQEPNRTEMIRQAVGMIRRKASIDSQSAQQHEATPRRPLSATEVPLVEGGAPPTVGEPRADNALQQAWAEYTEAAKIQDKGQRNRARKAAWEKILQLNGESLESLALKSFSVK